MPSTGRSTGSLAGIRKGSLRESLPARSFGFLVSVMGLVVIGWVIASILQRSITRVLATGPDLARTYNQAIADDASPQQTTHRVTVAPPLAVAPAIAAYMRVCAALLRGAVAGQLGDENRAGELLSGALVDARQAGLGELEIVALTQLAEWHLCADRLPEAQGHARDAVELAERAELRLRWADALNVLSRVERAAGDTEAAAQAARDAYLQAWCDGPPFSYAAGLDEARANLSAVGAPEPAGLDDFEPGEPFPEVLIKPTPRPEPT